MTAFLKFLTLTVLFVAVYGTALVCSLSFWGVWFALNGGAR